MNTAFEKQQTLESRVADAGWNIDWNAWSTLSDYEKSFFEIEFSGLRAYDYYLSRLKAIDFVGMGAVADIACGMGQWSMALAELNENVSGIDMNAGRIDFAKSLSVTMNRPNTAFFVGSMEKMDFQDESFDGLFCYGSFMFARMDVSLKEFQRLLKPGGKAYLNVNMAGWYVHLLLDRGLKKGNFPLMKTTISMAARTLKGETSNIIVRKTWIEKLFDENGFDIVETAPEGKILIRDDVTPPPSAYPSSHYGLPGVVEYVLKKR